jgi:hypothetical protein
MTDTELRQLDAEVHREVMNKSCQFVAGHLFEDERDCWIAVPHYSSDIAAAWLVVEKLRMTVTPKTDPTRSSRWLADVRLNGRDELWAGYGLTAPIAICRAALSAARDSPLEWFTTDPSASPLPHVVEGGPG